MNRQGSVWVWMLRICGNLSLVSPLGIVSKWTFLCTESRAVALHQPTEHFAPYRTRCSWKLPHCSVNSSLTGGHHIRPRSAIRQRDVPWTLARHFACTSSTSENGVSLAYTTISYTLMRETPPHLVPTSHTYFPHVTPAVLFVFAFKAFHTHAVLIM